MYVHMINFVVYTYIHTCYVICLCMYVHVYVHSYIPLFNLLILYTDKYQSYGGQGVLTTKVDSSLLGMCRNVTNTYVCYVRMSLSM